jgi:hypothetical protein
MWSARASAASRSATGRTRSYLLSGPTGHPHARRDGSGAAGEAGPARSLRAEAPTLGVDYPATGTSRAGGSAGWYGSVTSSPSSSILPSRRCPYADRSSAQRRGDGRSRARCRSAAIGHGGHPAPNMASSQATSLTCWNDAPPSESLVSRVRVLPGRRPPLSAGRCPQPAEAGSRQAPRQHHHLRAQYPPVRAPSGMLWSSSPPTYTPPPPPDGAGGYGSAQ